MTSPCGHLVKSVHVGIKYCKLKVQKNGGQTSSFSAGLSLVCRLLYLAGRLSIQNCEWMLCAVSYQIRRMYTVCVHDCAMLFQVRECTLSLLSAEYALTGI